MEQNAARRTLVRVAEAAHLTDDVVRLVLEPVEEGKLPDWDAGAHVDLHLASGLSRQYSLCGDSSDTTAYTVCVLREAAGRGGSAEVHDALTVGTELTISGPRNHFELVPAPRFLFVAGGIGITPVTAMIVEAERRGADWSLLYGGRSAASMVFAGELTERHGDRVTLVPQDVDGLIDVVRALADVEPGTHVYCCGPEGLLDAIGKACEAIGITDRLHIERFAAGEAPPPPVDGETAFEVELRRSGLTLTVGADQTLLEVVRDVRSDIDFSCQEGYCGSCESRVIEGSPDHRGTMMTPEEHDEDGTMLICVGRSRSPRLVLDL
ncbi:MULTISPECIES: PDR/VanB family oxidoreductase [Pseudonocardia]|uniref:Phenoxybenzoate dioxygenase subunit beta n=2 Tax=Pseudonocardia TaxID=1847 RepID=A0A1Y2N065_PSEAH|nr:MULTISPECIES: PDR/VanB family oxidoreductase [Pseudonocardia]OSY40810.1 Phenoxybenzoate dioxygenase subunit beta [Pseudonocardia autotrophica]TDN71882.1 ferredoxin-NADP reductase [Pseudonocardia autotrophica]BBG02570.1 ferredoxin [Pseudonocardia autotrophica]GEC24629.1 ferredoxin [Pseudonocardia saturnea]